jgi:hypothetical protein
MRLFAGSFSVVESGACFPTHAALKLQDELGHPGSSVGMIRDISVSAIPGL